MKLILITIVTLFASANADIKDSLKKGLLEPATMKPLINETVEYKPIKGHHFNLEAPQECGDDSTIKPTAKTVTCQFHSAGSRDVVVSVCDDEKSYCKQEKIKTEVQAAMSKEPKIKKGPSLETLKMQKEGKKKLLGNFKMMTQDEAVQAIPMKKAALVMVSTEWCPPCNMAKEFMMQTDAFKEATKDMLLIYVDGDSPASTSWMKKLKIAAYPSFAVLNKDLEMVTVFSSVYSNDFVEKVSSALKTLDDPIVSVMQRITERKQGSFLRKLKDFFNSDESIKNDEKRQIEYLASTYKMDELLKNIESMDSKENFVIEELNAKYFTLKEKDEEFLKTVLSQDPDDVYYYGALTEFCKKTQDEKTKKFSKECLDYKKTYLAYLGKDHDDLSSAEAKLLSAGNKKSKAELASFFEEPEEKVKALYAECKSQYDDLYELTPLKKKSRTVRLEQISCIKEEGQNLELLISLAKDYPYEETFHRKLSSHYSKNKDYVKALKEAELAVDYSYGGFWVMNMSKKAEVLEKLNRKKEALSVVETALSEVVIDDVDDKRLNYMLKNLRARQSSLQGPL